jgi:peptidoglycan/xylan/chitin deacetylase (PgdA/CDA1 family)
MTIPILMYHSVIDNDDNSVSIKAFENQMLLMKKMGYKTINFNNLSECDDKKKFIITFDDAYENIFLNAFPILKKLNFNATCFIVTNKIGDYNEWDKDRDSFKKMKLMNFNQINQWLMSGFNLGSHTLDHVDLTKIDNKDKINQIVNSKKFISDHFNTQVNSFAYPYGQYDSDVQKFIKEYYDFAVTTRRSRYIRNKFDYLLLPRVPINKSDNIFKFFLKIRTPYEDIKFRN